MFTAATANMSLSMAVGVPMRVRVGVVGVLVAMLVDTAGLLLQGSGIRNCTAVFHLYGFREENVVLEMNVLMKVILESFKCGEKCPIRDARVARDRKIVG